MVYMTTNHNPGVTYTTTAAVATCGCGWNGPDRDNAVTAGEDVRGHRVETGSVQRSGWLALAPKKG